MTEHERTGAGQGTSVPTPIQPDPPPSARYVHQLARSLVTGAATVCWTAAVAVVLGALVVEWHTGDFPGRWMLGVLALVTAGVTLHVLREQLPEPAPDGGLARDTPSGLARWRESGS